MISDEQSCPSSSVSGARGAAAPYAVVVTSPRGASTSALAPGRAYAIGRRADSDIHIDDPTVAEDHAILFGGDPPQVVDLGSPAGTTLDGRPIEPRVRHALDAASVLTMGLATLAIHRAHAPRSPESTTMRAAPECESDGEVLNVPLGGAGNAANTLVRILEHQYDRASSVVPDYPPALEVIVERALAHNPAERFRTADEMRVALEDFARRDDEPAGRAEP